MGGGGYNPWTTLRAWIYNLAVLNDEKLPIILGDAGKEFLRNIRWKIKPKDEWLKSIEDCPNIFTRL